METASVLYGSSPWLRPVSSRRGVVGVVEGPQPRKRRELKFKGKVNRKARVMPPRALSLKGTPRMYIPGQRTNGNEGDGRRLPNGESGVVMRGVGVKD